MAHRGVTQVVRARYKPENQKGGDLGQNSGLGLKIVQNDETGGRSKRCNSQLLVDFGMAISTGAGGPGTSLGTFDVGVSPFLDAGDAAFFFRKDRAGTRAFAAFALAAIVEWIRTSKRNNLSSVLFSGV